MFTVGYSGALYHCDRCGEHASSEFPLVILQSTNTPEGKKRAELNKIFLCESCLTICMNIFRDMSARVKAPA
jgi:hypothetical protein